MSGVFLTSRMPASFSGLRDLVAKCGCVAIAPKEFADDVRSVDANATVVAPDDPMVQEWIEVEGRYIPAKVGAAAYLLSREGRRVWMTGGFPSRISGPNQMTRFVRRLDEKDSQKTVDAVKVLAVDVADIWLPLRPIQAQNANLYDEDWKDVIEETAGLIEQWRQIRERAGGK